MWAVMLTSFEMDISLYLSTNKHFSNLWLYSTAQTQFRRKDMKRKAAVRKIQVHSESSVLSCDISQIALNP